MDKTLLVIVPGSNTMHDAVFTIVVAGTGEALASHLCSHAWYAQHDLYYRRPERIEEWGKRFGEVEIKFIDATNINEDELFRRHQEWVKANNKTA